MRGKPTSISLIGAATIIGLTRVCGSYARVFAERFSVPPRVASQYAKTKAVPLPAVRAIARPFSSMA
jgi:hypothetical protein